MSNMNLQRPLLFLIVAGFVAAAGCRLSPPKSQTGEGGMALCIEDPEIPSDADGGTDADDAGSNVDNVVTAVSCPSSEVTLKLNYVEPYEPDPALKTKVETTVATMSLQDRIKQMQGVLYGDAFHTQFTMIQRSQDTSDLRGFRYRDASRGMNLGEDMDGATQNAAVVNGEHIGYSTVFPVSMSRGAAFDLDLEYAIGRAVLQSRMDTARMLHRMLGARRPPVGALGVLHLYVVDGDTVQQELDRGIVAGRPAALSPEAAAPLRRAFSDAALPADRVRSRAGQGAGLRQDRAVLDP